VIHLDTSFLVDLLRETSRRKPGAATALRSRLEDEELTVSVHVVCELLAGAEQARHASDERQRVMNLCSAVEIAYPDERFAPTYARLLAALQQHGRMIGTMDLLISTAAVADEAALITRNTKEFSRVPGLTVMGY
jgi:tRNA(fMet)-specific endonuclease VapC